MYIRTKFFIYYTALRELHLKEDIISTAECNQLGRKYHDQIGRMRDHDWYRTLHLVVASKSPDAVKTAVSVFQSHNLESMGRDLTGRLSVSYNCI